MNASFEDKSIWVTLTGLIVVFVGYFWVAARMLAAGVTDMLPYVPVFAGAVVLLVILLIAGHVVVAVVSRDDGRDERDRLISWRAEHNSSWVLGVGAIGAIFCLALPIERVWVAHGLLMTLFLSTVLGHVLQLYYYRRGI